MAYDLTTVLGGGGGGIKSVQRGYSYTDQNSYTTTVNITAVNMSKAFVVHSSNNNTYNFQVSLSTSTTLVVFANDYTNSQGGVYWEVVEFE